MSSDRAYFVSELCSKLYVFEHPFILQLVRPVATLIINKLSSDRSASILSMRALKKK